MQTLPLEEYWKQIKLQNAWLEGVEEGIEIGTEIGLEKALRIGIKIGLEIVARSILMKYILIDTCFHSKTEY